MLGGPPPTDALRSLIELSAASHWRAALNAAQDAQVEAARGWFQNRRRGLFHTVGPCSRDAEVLHVGAASGVITEVLAESYERVVAVEWEADFVDFMRLRFRQDSITNVEVLQCSSSPLPSPGQFRLVVLDTGIGGRRGTTFLFRDETCQGSLLRECFRLLRPSGSISMATSNRFYGRRFSGASVAQTVRDSVIGHDRSEAC